MKNIFGSSAMIIATLLWGLAFSAQSKGKDYLDPFLFNSLRSLVGVAALIITIMTIDLIREKKVSVWGKALSPARKKELLQGGVWCGIIFAAATSAQQYGFKYEISAGKCGFLTALYIVIVPILGIFFKRRTSLILWIAVLFGILGAYILCGGVEQIAKGEWCVILCAVLYSGHILVIDRYAAECDCLRLSCLQFIFAAFITTFLSIIFREQWILNNILKSLPFWVFCGIGSNAIAFTLQMVAQKYLHPVTATLLMSLESVFAVLGGWFFLRETLSLQELIGCTVILCSVILAQIPGKKEVDRNN